MEQVMVKRLVGCQDSSHLIVVGRMDVLVNAVARELHLPRKGREGSGIFSRTSGRWRGEGVRCIIGTHLPGRDRTLISVHNPRLTLTQMFAFSQSAPSCLPTRPGGVLSRSEVWKRCTVDRGTLLAWGASFTREAA